MTRYIRILWLLAFIFSFNYELTAQNEIQSLRDKGYLALYQSITDLKSDFTLMSVAAHPDDEDIETLTYYHRKHGVQTVVVVATRGEGGQNEIGPELYRELGVIRTHEMWRSGAISGAEYFNMNLEEFGYSKSAEETFEKWGYEPPLRSLVFLIRKLKPDVIITNHDTSSGHGHHQATGILIRKAFDLAGDANKFVEQFARGVTAWQPKRLFQRTADEKEADCAIPVGDYDSIRGASYAEIAAQALSQQRSQGMDYFARRIKPGPRYTYYKLIKSNDEMEVKGKDLFRGLPDNFAYFQVNLSKKFQQQLTGLTKARQQSIMTFQTNLAELNNTLIHEIKLWRKLENETEKQNPLTDLIETQIQKLEKAIFYSLNLKTEIIVADNQVIKNQKVECKVLLFNGGKEPVKLYEIELMPNQKWFEAKNGKTITSSNVQLSYNQGDTTVINFQVPESSHYTVPETNVLYQNYHWQPLLKARIEYEYKGSKLHAVAEADIEILPDLEVSIEPGKTILPLIFSGKKKYFVVKIKNNRPGPTTGTVSFELFNLNQSNSHRLEKQSFTLARENEETAVKFDVPVPANISTGDFKGQAVLFFKNGNGRDSILKTECRVRAIDVQTMPGLKVGLVQSYDNTLQSALNQLGIENQLLSQKDLQWGDLSAFDTIILDIRAYLVRKDLRRNNERILNYVKNGGNLIVMYQKVFEWNPEYGNPPWAPFKLILSRNRVTSEIVPVYYLAADHPVLNYPNKILAADWEGWIQERGLYFPGEWDKRYLPILAMSDPGEPPLTGACLYTHYGVGTYLYTSLVWYRQLRALVPGAFRFLANIVIPVLKIE